jgi:holo-[acyl-carrier protein] synthase
MIYGLGTDIVALARVAALWQAHGAAFAAKVLTTVELQEFTSAREPARFLAKRFAAKEAFGKALGTGLRAPATLHNIGVGHDDLGKPIFVLHDSLTAHLQGAKLSAHLSLSDERDYVVAVAIVERSES